MILVDKPAGATSHDVVAQARRRLGRGVRAGHAGTLDPFATGLLLVLAGRATRTQRYFMALPKVYEVEARFGARSSTGDPEGEITETGLVPEGDLELPTGSVRQRPPAYSAVKIGGERAYRRARRGEVVEPPEREVLVHEFAETGREGDRRRFRVRCGSGTYVRSLIADLGDAYCTALRRTAIGPFDVGDADPDRVVAPADALRFLPEVRLDARDGERAGHGQAVAGAASGPVRLTDPAGLVAVAEPAGEGLLRPVVVLRG
ncbi:MAG: tRNA pseudouridine(55) synthase TruB [Solirubrobacteraceae bacterium]